MKKLTTGKIWLFAVGQFGWALLSGIISNWLVYFYQPDEASISQGQNGAEPEKSTPETENAGNGANTKPEE